MAPRRNAPERALVIGEVPHACLAADIARLPPAQRLVESGPFHVYWAHAKQIRSVLREIGRLRELTFRAVGEGSGKCCDIDPFDRYYLHLFVWDAEARAIVGAYRLGCVDEILRRHDVGGLYTHSLFRYGPGILDTLSPGLELGRSFICSRYQRSFASMLLLWRGIARYVTSAPRRAILFGPVSISNDYSVASRELIVRYLAAHMAEDRLRAQVLPRRPFALQPVGPAAGPPPPPRTVDELSRRITELEPDHKGVPVLLRQYLRLGARVLAFNVDRHFGDALDGLMMLDLRLVEPALLARYMGTAGMTAFRQYHGLESQPNIRPRPAIVPPHVAWPLTAVAIPVTGSLAAGDPIE